jgi:hypothetical protein
MVPAGWNFAAPNDPPNSVVGTPGQLYTGYNGLADSGITAYQTILYMWFEAPGEGGMWKAAAFNNPGE